MITQEIHLKTATYGIPPVVHMVQGDSGRELNMVLDDMELDASNDAVLAIHRPDDSYYEQEATVVFAANSVTAPAYQAITRLGKVECQLKISDSDELLSTFDFIIMVHESVVGLPVEQLGYDIYDLIAAAGQIQGTGLTDDIKQALLDCFEHVAWTDEHGQDYVDALEAALYPPAELASISAVYTQSETVYDTDTLDSLRSDLVVTAHYDDFSTQTVTDYTLSGTLTEGTSTITVSYGGKTTTFNVTVTEYVLQYSVTNSLTNCTSDNASTSVNENASYTAHLTANSGYVILSATVTVGGDDVTSTVYSNGTITIAEVTGDVTIYCEAKAVTIVNVTWAQGGLNNQGKSTSYDANRYANYYSSNYIPMSKNQTLILYNTNPNWTNKHTYNGTDYIESGAVFYQTAGTDGNNDGSYIYPWTGTQVESSVLMFKSDQTVVSNYSKTVAVRLFSYNMADYYQTAVVGIIDGV